MYPPVNRRNFLIIQALVLVNPAWALANPVQKVQTLEGALTWLDALEKSAAPRSNGAWPLAAVLDHLAQSIEMSMRGFPEPKGALFQSTVGAAAFAVFKWRGKMSHSLDEPIPGAPPLAVTASWQSTSLRLRKAILAFEGYSGALKPHFAYGALSKTDFALAHVFHIANHQDEIVLKS
jgi:Protein of unknown function (DUF1569)